MLSRFESFIYNINGIDLYWHRIANDVMKAYNLKGNYALYFTRLYGNPNGLTAAQLASLCAKDKADVSRDIAVLIKAGMVEKHAVSSSGYRALLTLTDDGREISEKIIAIVDTAVSSVGQDYSPAEQASFTRVLETIHQNMKALSESNLLTESNKGE